LLVLSAIFKVQPDAKNFFQPPTSCTPNLFTFKKTILPLRLHRKTRLARLCLTASTKGFCNCLSNGNSSVAMSSNAGLATTTEASPPCSRTGGHSISMGSRRVVRRSSGL